ncbi:hypothetical protein POTOM_020314 [Populus tomentosa]|uniref:Pectinesterase inhibitor domain-containing protein n=1 Tax=Populus tomentosa TaxID=118781 RepID=A0A8X8D0C3_POPTO|nr:hypothetical protein POTOM_020314 [Populus tomentosa]
MFAKTSLENPQDKRMLKEATTRIAEKRVRADEIIERYDGASELKRGSSVVINVIILLTNPTLSEAQDSQVLIDEVCRQMEDYGFCNRVFHENMKSPSIDYVGLTAIAMDQTITNATNTYEYILDLLRNTTDQSLRNVLVACENAFGIVKSSFGDALQSFNRKDYDDMFKLERGAPRAQASCETSFIAPPSPPNPLAERNREMRILITMAIVSGKEILKR